jgi:undecaprenyl-diphosphatase
MLLWHAVILGLVEGVTEYLPVSSTGHLILTSALLGLDEGAIKQHVDAFNIVIQGGAILAVVGLYWPRIVQMLKGLVGRDAQGRRLLINLVVAFLPAAVLGVALNDWIEARLFHAGPVLLALALGGIWMIWLDRWRASKLAQEDRARNAAAGDNDNNADADGHNDAHAEADAHSRFRLTVDDLDWKRALVIGLFQVVAMWPGTSRSMMTIAGGTLLGLRPKDAAEFSFLLGLPTLGGACVYSLGKNLLEAREAGEPNMFEVLGWAPVLVGVAVATVSAALAVKWLVAFLTKHGLALFGWYRLLLCAVLGGAIAAGIVSI